MSKTQIIDFLPRLNAADLAEVQAKLDELAGESWLANSNLSQSDRDLLEQALVDYNEHPEAGSPWETVKARILNGLQR